VFAFTDPEWFKVDGGKGDAAVVPNPHECDDFYHLIGQHVLIDGQVRRVRGVERFMHMPPWRAGERISLWLYPTPSAPDAIPEELRQEK
jgi:hypothetical protein